MAASILSTQLLKAGLSVKAGHASLSEVPDDADVVVCSSVLYDRALMQVPKGTPVFKVDDLMNQEEHKKIAQQIAAMAE